MKLTIFTDGASRGNPGHAAFGFTISKGEKLFHEEGGYIGITTNNVAEYTALIRALEYVGKLTVQLPIEVEVFADSKLLIMQMSGKFKVKSAHIKELILQARELEKRLGKVFYTHIPREQNKMADKLANLALDSR